MSTVVLSRTDRIGDVVLTLPMAGIIKELFPRSRVVFLARRYTRPVLEACEHVDDVLEWDELSELAEDEAARRVAATGAETFIHVFTRREIARLARRAQVPLRVGTLNRPYHFGTCNKLVRLSRRRSKLHEAQLNLKLLIPFGARRLYDLPSISPYYGLTRLEPLAPDLAALVDGGRFNLVVHPRTGGSGPEWGDDNFAHLIGLLPADAYRVFITGTEEEGKAVRSSLPLDAGNVHDLTGRLSLSQLISFLARVDGLVAGSTGPLHLAAALGKKAIGVYAPGLLTHPRRWSPVGARARALVLDKACKGCSPGEPCPCIRSVSPAQVASVLLDGI